MNYTKLSKTQFGGDTINLSFKSNLVSMMNTYKTFWFFKCKLVIVTVTSVSIPTETAL